MPSNTDYIAATVAAMASEVAPEVTAPAAPAAAEPAAEAAPEGSTAPVEGSAAAETPKEEPAAPAPAKTREAATLEDVAKAKSELRKEREALAAESQPVKQVLAAIKSRDAMALLAAAGISWADAARQVLEGSGSKPPQGKKEDPAEPSPLAQEVAALRKELDDRRASETKASVLAEVKTLVKANPKFKLTEKRGAESAVISFIEQYHAETGELPGSTLAESLEIAAEAVEGQLAKQAAEWRKVLQADEQPATKDLTKEVPAAKAGVVSQQSSKTLTNNSGTGPKAAPVPPKKPKEAEDYQALALAALTAQ